MRIRGADQTARTAGDGTTRPLPNRPFPRAGQPCREGCRRPVGGLYISREGGDHSNRSPAVEPSRTLQATPRAPSSPTSATLPDVFSFSDEIVLPRPVSEVFALLSNPHNLDGLTPPWVSFALAGEVPWPLRGGDRVAYRFRWHGLPLPWVSEIVSWRTDRELTYRQARGPYRAFVHRHDFSPTREGTRVADRIRFEVFGGSLVAGIVRKDLDRLFAWRRDRLRSWAREGAIGPRREGIA